MPSYQDIVTKRDNLFKERPRTFRFLVFRGLPACFDDAGNKTLVGHFTEAKTGHFKFTEVSTRSASELASVFQAGGGGVLREFVERELG